MKKLLACFLMFCMGIVSNSCGVEYFHRSWWSHYRIPTESIIGIRIALMLILVILLVLLFIELYKNNKYHVHLSKKIILFALCIIMIIITGTIIFVRSIGVEEFLGADICYNCDCNFSRLIRHIFDFTEW